MRIFEYIKADKFFPSYAPQIKNHKRKISGHNGRGNPCEFTVEDKKAIKQGLKKLFNDLNQST